MPKNKFRIHHLSSCPPMGGASRAGLRLHEQLAKSGHESFWIQAGKQIPETVNVLNWKEERQKKSKIRRSLFKHRDLSLFKKDFSSTTTFASPASGYGKPRGFEKFPPPDIYNFHWVSNFLDWSTSIPALTEHTPIIWTLHDMNTFSGVWHYKPEDHEINKARNKWDQYVRETKRTILSQVPTNKLFFVCPSKWMADECKHSDLTHRFKTVCIPYGLNTDLYHPICKNTAKSALGIPESTSVIGFIADNIDDPRKGMKDLLNALPEVTSNNELLLLTAGKTNLKPSRHRILNLGSISSTQIIRQFYSACDVFVCPSKQDNLPNTVMESMACGTPVIANKTGGIPDMVDHEENGILTNSGDTTSLKIAIEQLINTPPLAKRMGTLAREKVLTHFKSEQSAERYLELYNEALNK